MTKSKATKIAKKLRKDLSKKHPIKKLEKEVGKVVVTGHGDYVPTKFNRVKGRGGYFSDFLGGIASGVTGVANTVGGVLDTAHGVLKSITGMGDYRERARKHAQLSKGKKFEDQITNWQTMNMGAMNVQFGGGTAPKIAHREFIGYVYSSTLFATTEYRIQPGLRGTKVLFPWGSSVANCFEQYQLNGMILEYKSTSTNYSSTQSLGSVMMSTVYDAEAPLLANQLAVNNHEFTTSDEPCNSFIHPIELALDQSSLATHYVDSSNASASGSDSRFNDIGIFQISTVGNQTDGAVIGELWCSYDLTLLKPLLPDLHAGTTYFDSIICNMNGTPGQLLDGAHSIDQESSYPVKYVNASIMQLPVGYAGTYQMTIWCSGFGETTFGKTVPRVSSWGTDITPMFFAPGTTGVRRAANHIQTLAAITGDAIYHDWTNSANGVGSIETFQFSTIAESLANNTITFTLPSGFSASGTVCAAILINAVDNDMLSGTFGPSLPTAALRRKSPSALQVEAEMQRRIADYDEKQRLLESKLLRLEAFLTRSNSPIVVEEEKESELEKSVHLSKEELNRLLNPDSGPSSNLAQVPRFLKSMMQ